MSTQDVANGLDGDALKTLVSLAEAQQEQLEILFRQVLDSISKCPSCIMEVTNLVKQAAQTKA